MQCGVLTQTQTGVGGDGGWIEHRGVDSRAISRDAGCINRGLADVGLIQSVLGAIEAEGFEVHAEDFPGNVEHFFRAAGCLVKVLTHADNLSALAGTEDECFGRHQNRTTALDQVSPAPKATKITVSPE